MTRTAAAKKGAQAVSMAAFRLLLALAAAAVVPPCLAADAEAADIDDSLRSLIQKQKLKQAMASKETGADKDNNRAGCGSIDIGNTAPSKGAGRVADRDKVVVVTGPVVNATKCR